MIIRTPVIPFISIVFNNLTIVLPLFLGNFFCMVQAQVAPELIKAGKELSKTCNACHGFNGLSVTPKWPSLAGQSKAYLTKQLLDFKNGTRYEALMSPMAEVLSNTEIEALASYFSSLTPPTFVSKQGGRTHVEGKTLFQEGSLERGIPACMTCHGPGAKGIDILKTPSLAGQRSDYIKTQILNFRAGRRKNDEGAIMRESVKLLKYKEIKWLSQYLESL